MTLSPYSKLLALPVPLMANPRLCRAAAAAVAAPLAPKPVRTSTTTCAGGTVAATPELVDAADVDEPAVKLVPGATVEEVGDVGVAGPPRGDDEEEEEEEEDEEAGDEEEGADDGCGEGGAEEVAKVDGGA